MPEKVTVSVVPVRPFVKVLKIANAPPPPVCGPSSTNPALLVVFEDWAWTTATTVETVPEVRTGLPTAVSNRLPMMAPPPKLLVMTPSSYWIVPTSFCGGATFGFTAAPGALAAFFAFL